MDRLIGGADVERLGVGVGIDGDGADAHLARGADDPARDLAAVGDEEGGDHVSIGSWKLSLAECRLLRRQRTPHLATQQPEELDQ